MSSLPSLPREIHQSAERGELQKVAKWLRKGGAVDAFRSTRTHDGDLTTESLMHVSQPRTAACDQLELVRELMKQGASVDLPSNFGYTALMGAASYDHLSIVLVLLQHSATPDLRDTHGSTALMGAADAGQEACVQALCSKPRPTLTCSPTTAPPRS